MKSNLEILLGEWGRWKAKENNGAQGYPKAAAFTSERVQGARRSDDLTQVIDEPMHKVDSIIAASHPDARRVLIAHYIWAGPVKAKIERLHVSRTWFYGQLEMAHHMVGHAMGGKFALEPVIALDV